MDNQEINKIIKEYGIILEKVINESGLRLLYPESKLPYPKNRIKEALKQSLFLTNTPEERDILKAGLIYLEDFVPDENVPDNLEENIKKWAELQKVNKD